MSLPSRHPLGAFIAVLIAVAHPLAAQSPRDIFADTWAATDSLGRILPAPAVTGQPRSDKTIALFYFIWNGSHTTGLYDISKIIAQDPDAIHEFANPLWGPRNHWHFWGEPLFGYYRMQDPWVIRRHAQMLTDAGVDAIFFDVTNAVTYKPVYDLILSTYADMRAAGQDTPKVAFLTWSNSGTTAQAIYNDLYEPGRHSDLWFRWNGKPLILAKAEELSPTLLDFFTVRRSWAWQPGEDRWPWLETEPQKGGWTGSPTNLEQASVAAASHPHAGSGNGKSFHLTKQPPNTARNTALGIKFANQWRRALEVDPALVLITQWNEWTAQRAQYTGSGSTYAMRPLITNDPYFIDVFDDEFNRDIEPMTGGYGDNFYYQLIDHARRYKGTRSVAAASPPATINLQDFNSWSGVGPEFLDDHADITHRSHAGFGSRFYTDTTGRNDISRALVARDNSNIYLYVETVAALSEKSAADAWWMNCFLRDETATAPDWEGYHFRLSNENPAGANLTLSRSTGGWNWTPVAEVSTHRAGNRMAVAIPRTLLGLSSTSTHARLSFKWSDNQQKPTADGWLLHGDAAPNARFRYTFRAPGAHTSSPLSGRSYQLVHRTSLQLATPDGTSLNSGSALRLAADAMNPIQKWTLFDTGSGRWALFSTRAAIVNGPAIPLVIEAPGDSPGNGLPLQLGSWNQSNHQSWTLAPTGDGWFRLVNAATGMALAVGPDGSLIQSSATDSPAQHWSLEPAAPVESGERYRFTNRQSGLLANLANNGMNPGDASIQSTRNGGLNQQWIAYPLAPDRVQLAGNESRRPLQAAGFSAADGTAVVQGDWSSNAFQQWEIRMVAPGYFQWINVGSGLAAGVLGGSSAAGAALAQRPASSAMIDTQWRISLAADTLLEIDPAESIPSTHTPVFATEWNTANNKEAWTTSSFNLAAGTPIGGELTGTASGVDPQLIRSGLSLITGENTIVEFRLRKEATDNSLIELYWTDANGGISGSRVVNISSIPNDGEFHTYRITLSGQITGAITGFRLDVASGSVGNGKTVYVDYFRVYSELPARNLTWDPAITGGTSPGGPGTWNTSSNFWWDDAQNPWPGISSRFDTATFAVTGGTVTIDPAGVTASTVIFNSAGYSLTGGPLTLDGSSVLRSTGVTTNIVSPLAASSRLALQGAGGSAGFILRGNNTALTGPVLMTTKYLGFTQNTALGSGTFTAGNGGNIFISALDGDRALANDVVFAGNRLIIDSSAMGTGLTVGNLTINGGLVLNGTSPADFWLRRNLTVNGVVSGNNSGSGLLLDGDARTLTLTGDNTFTGNIRWNNNSVVAADSDAALGASANILNFNRGSGSVRLLAAFDSARPIVIANNVAGAAGANTTNGRIDTNGFDSTWSGTISGAAFAAPATNQQNTGFAKLGAGTLTLDPGVGTDNNLRLGGIAVQGGTLKIASGTFSSGSASGGISAGCLLEINGGSFTTGNFGVDTTAGTGTFTLNTGGTYTNGGELIISFGGDGVCNINGGLADLNQFSMVNAAPNVSTMNLNGGEVRLNFFNARANAATPATAVINFNGSLVRAKSNNADFIETDSTTVVTAHVQAGGAIFNTRDAADPTSYAITIKQSLLHDPALGVSPDGGLTKNGLGTLTLAPVAGPNTYTGPTTVNAGILSLGNIGTIPSLANVTVSSGAGFGGVVGVGGLADADLQNIVNAAIWPGSGAFLVIDTNGANVTVAANITGNIGLIKKGLGVLTLTGTNTYTGPTVVEAGSIASGGAAVISVTSVFRPNGTDFTINFVADGNVDIYRSSTLTAPWTRVGDNVAASPFTDTTATGDKNFYVVIAAGKPFP